MGEFIGTILGYGIAAVIIIVIIAVALYYFVAFLPILIIILVLGVIVFVLDKIFGFTEESSAQGIINHLDEIVYLMGTLV